MFLRSCIGPAVRRGDPQVSRRGLTEGVLLRSIHLTTYRNLTNTFSPSPCNSGTCEPPLCWTTFSLT